MVLKFVIFKAMNVYLNVNTTAIVKFTNRLEQMRRHDFPVAIRGTLNRAAFDVKQRTMPASFEEHFVRRNPNFAKANSRVQMAQGLQVSSMRSIVGFTPMTAQYNNKAVEELEEQEYGGTINNRTLIPTESARTGNNRVTPVRPKNRLRSIGRLESRAVKAAQLSGPNRRYKFVKAAVKAGPGGYVIAGLRKTMLYRIESVSRKFGRTFIKQTPIYSYAKGRSVHIRQTKFMREASLSSASRLEKFYIEEANRRFKKAR